MKYYIEITLIDDSDYSLPQLWCKLYMQIHLALVEQQNPDKTVNIGVSFPEYQYTEKGGVEFTILGSKLRVFANTEHELVKLNLTKWLERLMNYVHIKSIQPVPDKSNCYLLVKRYRVDMSLESLTRRFMRRESKRTGRKISFEEARSIQNQRFAKINNLTLQEAKKHYEEPNIKNLPFIKLKSLSSQKEYSLLIEQTSVEQQCTGSFNTYGLSSQNTVPHW